MNALGLLLIMMGICLIMVGVYSQPSTKEKSDAYDLSEEELENIKRGIENEFIIKQMKVSDVFQPMFVPANVWLRYPMSNVDEKEDYNRLYDNLQTILDDMNEQYTQLEKNEKSMGQKQISEQYNELSEQFTENYKLVRNKLSKLVNNKENNLLAI